MTTLSESRAPAPPPTPEAPFPVRVRGRFDPTISRWLWLVKWVLLIPHVVVLTLLWAALAVVGVIAFVAILATGRYPRTLFDFTVGVLRWSWRVAFYGQAAFGTDRYPPFSLRADDSYPADLEVDRPERLSRGLVLVKWWLLALPQYVVVGILTSGPWWVWRGEDTEWSWGAGGFVGLLALVGIVVHAVGGTYPRGLPALVVGLDRWVLRVGAYALLLTDRYPPFRLDMGEDEPGTAPEVDAEGIHGSGAGSGAAPGTADRGRGWSAGPVVALVLGALLCLGALLPLAGGAGALVADRTGRDADGMITTSPVTVSGAGYALRSRSVLLDAPPAPRAVLGPAAALGTVRVRVTPVDPARPLFVGIAPRGAVDAYLAGVATSTMADGFRSGGVTVVERPGGPPRRAPGAAGIWVASSAGTGPRTVEWQAAPGAWSLVVLDPARPGIAATLDVGARVPGLAALGLSLLAVGAVVAVVGGAVMILAIVTVHRRHGGDHPDGGRR